MFKPESGESLSWCLNCPSQWVRRFWREPLDIRRCITDGELLTTSEAHLRLHSGHRVKFPSKVSFWEFLLIQLGVIHD